jgi:threonine dehydrogenase-like Zn-dependent dehydrogenase
MKAIQYIKSVPRYLLVRSVGRHLRRFPTGPLSCIRLADLPEPRLPTPRWVVVKTHLSGICGSDLTTITAQGSPYFSPFTSCPFVLGHEVTGEIAQVGSHVEGWSVGERVTIEPALCCAVRGIDPPCRQCQVENFGNCENVTHGDISPGIQTGYCRDTGGGWSPYFVAHPFQLHRLPEGLSPEEDVLLEPFSCALHAVLKARVRETDRILIIGCGTMGLLTLVALKLIRPSCRVAVVAKYPHQERLASQLGTDETLRPDRTLYAHITRTFEAEEHHPELGKPVLIGGVDTTFDCVGSATTIDDALRFTRSKGRVIIVGMPSIPKGVDWTSIWYKELDVVGAYTYGMEDYEGRRVRTFDLSIDLMKQTGGRLRGLVGRSFRLHDYRDAIDHALYTGKSGSVKTVFDLREER